MQSRLFLFIAMSAGAGVRVALAEPPPTAGIPVEAVAGGEPSKLHPALLREFAGRTGDHRVKAWVFFEDSKGSATDAQRDVALRDLRSTYHPRSVQRRHLRRTDPGLFDVRDLPVPTRYVEAVRAMGVRVGVVSRWVNAASVWGTQRQLTEMARLPFVKEIQPVRRGGKPDPVNIRDTGGVAATAGFYGESEEQLTQINLIALHNAGFTGAGVIVGILDTGFQRTHDAFTQSGHLLTVVAEHDFINDDGNTAIEPGDPPSQHSHGTRILGTIGAYKPNLLVGGAYNASFILCKTEDITSETPVEEDYYVAGLEYIEANGGDMATASLGYIDWYTQADLNGLTAVTTIAVNAATANGVHCCNAAGNEGHDANPLTSHLIAPADAFKVLTCGAVDNTGLIASFSSDGPSADGRVKPEVLARGVNTRSVSSSDNTTTSGSNGTSLSTPLVASAVACLIEAHPDWTVDQMRWYLLHTAKDYVANHTYDANYVRGYGIIDALVASKGDCNANGIPDATDIADGTSNDCNANGIPDECDIASCPTGDPPCQDCNRNNILDECDIAGGASVDLDGNGVPDDCYPPPLPDPSGTDKNRYISLFLPPPSVESGPLTALRVTLVDLQNPVPPNLPQSQPPDFSAYELATCTAPGEASGCARWVGKPGTFLESQDIPGLGSFRGARLQCTPYYHDWNVEGVIHVTGAEIVPSSIYHVESVSTACMGQEPTCTAVSTPAQITTARSGDITERFNPPDPSTQPDALDVAQLVNKFKSLSSAPIKAIAQLQSNLPELNADINALDVVAVVDAVKQKAYAFSGPCACPSTVTCGSTSCTSPTQCAGLGAGSMCVKTCAGGDNDGDPCINDTHCPGSPPGTCGNGFCRDRCGRCTP